MFGGKKGMQYCAQQIFINSIERKNNDYVNFKLSFRHPIRTKNEGPMSLIPNSN